MTTKIQNRSRRLRHLLLPLGLALACVGHQAAQAQTLSPAPECSEALASLISQWNAIGYAEPSKPSQMIVSGRHGYTTTAGRYYFLRQQIRDSARECEAGHDLEARQNIAMVRRSLNPNVQYGD